MMAVKATAKYKQTVATTKISTIVANNNTN